MSSRELSSVDFDKINNHLENLTEILCSSKFSTTLKIITTTSSHTCNLEPILHLEQNKNYQIALTSFSTLTLFKTLSKM